MHGVQGRPLYLGKAAYCCPRCNPVRSLPYHTTGAWTPLELNKQDAPRRSVVGGLGTWKHRGLVKLLQSGWLAEISYRQIKQTRLVVLGQCMIRGIRIAGRRGGRESTVVGEDGGQPGARANGQKYHKQAQTSRCTKNAPSAWGSPQMLATDTPVHKWRRCSTHRRDPSFVERQPVFVVKLQR